MTSSKHGVPHVNGQPSATGACRLGRAMSAASAATPGPYRGRTMGQAGNIRLYSAKTAETIAYVLCREWGDYENAPDGETALKNFQLLRHAPEMLAALHACAERWNGAVDADAVNPESLTLWFAAWLRSIRPVLAGVQGQSCCT